MAIHTKLVGYKHWADSALYSVISTHLERLDPVDRGVLMQILDHMHAVDCIFRCHLLGQQHAYKAPRSNEPLPFERLSEQVSDTNDWYADYIDTLSVAELEEVVHFVFTNGSPASMSRGDMLLHICLHGTYHRGNAGIILQKNGIRPNDDRMTDFLQRRPHHVCG